MDSTKTILVRGACPHDCPDTCATITEVRDGRARAFYADKSHPFTDGWLCAKVRPYLDRVYHPDRLRYPLRRTGAKGAAEWERISWDEAIATIAERWRRIIDEDGAAAILPYSFSGTLGLVQNAVTASRLWNRMGASGLERSICGAAAETVVTLTVGSRWSPDPEDVQHSKLVVIWGHNPASTNPHFMPFLRKAQKAGARVVVIDPRRTLTARSADLHLQPRPATDGALALGLINLIFQENRHDEPWLEANTVGWRELRERATEYPLERVAGITGLEPDTIVALARDFAAIKPALLKFADGIQRHGNGGQTARALCALPAVTGQYGVRGGGLYYSASGWAAWDERAVGHADVCPPSPRIVNMNRLGAALNGEVSDPPIRSLYVFNANPVASTPNTPRIIEGLLRDDLFTVVHDIFMTDTARYADIVLPATTQLEQVDLHRPYGHRHLQYNHQAIEPLYEARCNWDVMRALAAAMGYDEPWLRQRAEEVIREVVDASALINPRLAGITLERLQAEGTVRLRLDAATEVPFADLRFPTPSGKVELLCQAMAAFGEDSLPYYEPPAEFRGRDLDDGRLVLISGAPHHFVSSSLANLPTLVRKEGAPALEINPTDAAARGIADGDEVVIENARGWCRLLAHVTDDVPVGVVVSPKGKWPSHSPDCRNVNWTTSDSVADVAGQSTFHSNLISVRPVKCGVRAERELAVAPSDD